MSDVAAQVGVTIVVVFLCFSVLGAVTIRLFFAYDDALCEFRKGRCRVRV